MKTSKEPSLTVKICDWTMKHSIYAVIFLLPVLFLPWTSDALDFNKQTLLVALMVIALFCWMLKVLVAGKLEIRLSKIHLGAGALFLVYLLATVFSLNRYGSFWGWPQISAESLLSLMALSVFYFLISNTFSKKEILASVKIFSVAAALAELFGLLQLFGIFIIPFSFAKSVSFNTIGSVGALGMFAAILLPLATMLLISAKKWWKALFTVELLLSGLVLLVVDYSMIWWVVVAGSALVMIFGIMKRNIFDGRWMAIPMFFLAISLFFILLNPQISWLSQKANEIFLSQGASASISLQTIKERPLFGSGPGTFVDDFSKFKDPGFGKTSLWNITFTQATSKVLNDLASTGILGLVALLALMALPIYYGIKFLIFDKSLSDDLSYKESVKVYWMLVLGIATALVAQAVSYFLYNPNLVLSFLNFFMIAALVGLIAQEKKIYALKPSSLTTLITTFIFTLLFIFGLGLLILDGQRYVAEVNYYQGVASWQSGNPAAGIKNLESAARLNSSSDLYFVQLSQAYLATLEDQLKNTTSALSDAQKSTIQGLISNAINAAKIATDLNPSNPADWSNRAYVYQSLNGLVGDSTTWALSSYDSALALDPNDPYLWYQEGNVNFAAASTNAGQKSQFLATAKSKLERAVNLNPTYSDALYSLGLVYDAMGDTADSIKEFTLVLQLNPKNASIEAILSNLNAGLPALSQPAPIASPPPTTAVKNSSTDSIAPVPATKAK